MTLLPSNVFKQSMRVCFSFKFHLNNNNKILKAMDIHNQREKRLGTQQVSHFSKITKIKILYISRSEKS